MDSVDEGARAVALEFTRRIAAFWAEELGTRLIGIYLLGSLAHGGFSRRYSDIDIGLIVGNPLETDAIERMRGRAAALSTDLAPKLSLFWTDRDFSMGRFPPLDRADYLDHGIALIERERIRPARPSIDDVRAYLRGTPLENWERTAARFAALDALEPKEHKPYLRAHLYPARFVYSWMTGRMASNDEAVAFLQEHSPAGLDVGLVERALAIRHAAADPDALFPSRGLLPGQVEACARLVACWHAR